MSDEPDDECQPERKKRDMELLGTLSAREAKILRKRFAIDTQTGDVSLEEVQMQFEVTRERIKEIERKALERLHGIGGPDDAA